jgi:16S rRNA G966 N2-methylase RsmD
VLPVRAEALDADALGAGTVSLLFADPPYRIDALRVRYVLERLDGVFVPGAIVIYEHAEGVVPSWPETFHAVGDRRYGGTVVSFARHEG